MRRCSGYYPGVDAILPELLTAHEVGLWLGQPPARVLRLAKRGAIPSLTLPGGDVVFDRAELAEWVDKLRRERAAACAAD